MLFHMDILREVQVFQDFLERRCGLGVKHLEVGINVSL